MASRIPEAPAGPPASGRSAIAGAVIRRGRQAIEMLLEARDFARDLDRDIWDFALEIETLQRHGLTHSDLRWLVCKGYLEQLNEVFPASGPKRSFRPGGLLSFTETSCFVITDAGLQLLRQFFPAASALRGVADAACRGSSTSLDQGDPQPASPANPEPLQPRWDRDRQELRLGEWVVKRFKVPAPNQEVVLAVFDEEGWPVRIDDPLPPRPELNPKRRLHDTINSLNRNQKTPLIHFLGDGTGRGVRWEVNDAGGRGACIGASRCPESAGAGNAGGPGVRELGADT